VRAGSSLRQKLIEGHLFIALTTTNIVQLNVEQAEKGMKSLATSVIEDDMLRFKLLIRFRRLVGNCYGDLKRSQAYTLACLGPRPPSYLLASGGGSNNETNPDVHVSEAGSAKVIARREQGGENISTIRDRQAGLEKRLDAIKEDLNEEIQVTVSTVQVHDAQVMKEQAAVTARQTTWTVALTVLAAVYLPMTLVTGIFGMNITEISSEKTARNAWWAVGA
jgi:hypothetical protein